MLALSLRVPKAGSDGWTKWLVGGPEDAHAEATWYVDGSFIDDGHPDAGRTGFAIAVVGPDGDVCGLCHGAPPAWITNAAGAEGWALYTVLRASPLPPRIVTDCLGLIRQLQRGLDDATAHFRPLARLWRLISLTLDGTVPEGWLDERFVWMPAHTSRAAAGKRTRSDGRPLTLRDWRCNRLADALAKAAVASDRLPAPLRALLKQAGRASDFAAASLGLVTHAANNYLHTDWGHDGTPTTTKKRDAWLPPYLNRGGGHRPRATGTRKRKRGEEQPGAPSPAAQREELQALETAAAERLKHAKEARGRARALTTLREAEREGRAVQAWYSQRAQAPIQREPGTPSAAERLAALRQRVLAKAATSHA